MNINSVHDLEEGDIVEIGEPVDIALPVYIEDTSWLVKDIDIKSIGITETFVVALVSDAESDNRICFAIGTTDSSPTFTLEVYEDVSTIDDIEINECDETYDIWWRQVRKKDDE